MCWPIAVMAPYLATAAAVAGTAYSAISSSQAQSQAANALAQQNQATMAAQNTAFTQRMAAAQAQTAGQTAAMQQTLTDQATSAEQMRQQQMSALKGYQNVLDTENTQAASLRGAGDAAAQQLLQQTSQPVLNAAQTNQSQQAAALLSANMPLGVTGPQPSDPTGSTDAAAGDPATKAALARRTAEAATNIRTYGSKIGALSAYDAPINTTNLAISANKTGIMPAEAADVLLRAGNNTRLLPSQIAYGAATGEGQTQQALLQSRGQSALDAAGLSYGNAVSVANLQQSDADTIAANKAAQAKQDAAYQQSLAGIVSGVSNLGLYAAGRYGPTPGFLDTTTPRFSTYNATPTPGGIS